MEKITVVGVGPGDEGHLTGRAKEAIAQAELVYAAARHAALSLPARLRPLEPLAAAIPAIEADWRRGRRVAVLASGDAGLYGLLPMFSARFGRENLDVIPGISAVQALAAALSEAWQDARILSAHGRALSEGALADAVRRGGSTYLYCDGTRTPGWACGVLARAGLTRLEVAVGERLSYPDGRVFAGTPEAVLRESFDPLAVLRILNPDPRPGRPPLGLPDTAFARGKTPMTKREVRALALAALRLEPGSRVWDVGAGTGSVSVECALQCPLGEVFAVERDEDAIGLIRANAEKFGLVNLTVVHGAAPEALWGLPAPDRVFLGGSGGMADGIVARVEALKEPVRLVATAVTLESAGFLTARLAAWKNFEAFQVAVSRLEPAGASHLIRAQNPVFIVSADWEGAK